MPGDDDAPTKVDEPSTEAAPADPVSTAAVAAHAQRLRPFRIIYAATVIAVVVIALVIVKIAYDHGEISHVHLQTIESAPPSISNAPTPSTTLTQAWSSTDATAIGAPVAEGTVVTYDEHTMRGRDALTGKQTWSYTRTDRTLCTAIQSQSVAIAVYRLDGNCDELTALDATTGTRRWTRTLDKDGAVFDGPATYQVDGSNVMFVSRTSIYAVSIGGTEDEGNGGLDYWTFYHVGCTINGAVLGSSGALISQTCHGQDCSGHKFCGDGTQLLLRDGSTGYDDKSTTNPDIVKWNDLGTDLVPTSSGNTVTARDPDGATLHAFNVKTGKQTAQLALTGDSGTQAPSGYVSGTDGDAIWIGTRLYALSSGSTSFRWQLPSTTTPTVSVVAQLFKAQPALTTTRSAVVAFDPSTGKVTTRYRVPVPVAGSMVYPLGAGLLVGGPHTVVYR